MDEKLYRQSMTMICSVCAMALIGIAVWQGKIDVLEALGALSAIGIGVGIRKSKGDLTLTKKDKR